MLTDERHARICDTIQARGAVTVAELSATFEVSTETVRRDLLYLEKQNLLKRVHGGAVAVTRMKRFLNFKERQNENTDEKRQLSAIAANFIDDGDIIALDSGSTAIAFAECIKNRFRHLTVVVHDLSLFRILSDVRGMKVILVGGEYFSDIDCFYGPLLLQTLDNLHVDKAFICPSAVSLAHGVADYVSELIPVQKKLLAISDMQIIMADSSKYEKAAMLKICDVTDAMIFVSDSGLDVGIRELYRDNHVRLYTDENAIAQAHEKEI